MRTTSGMCSESSLSTTSTSSFANSKSKWTVPLGRTSKERETEARGGGNPRSRHCGQSLITSGTAEITASGCSHVIPLLRVVRPPNGPHVALVTPHLPGGDLFEHLECHGPFAEPDARAIMHQVFSALQYLHSRHIVHRDLKPENCLLFQEGNRLRILRISDLGSSTFSPGR